MGRSAFNFWDRERTAALLAADAAWKPTVVVLMLGTNDIGLSLAKDREALQRLVEAYRQLGAKVVAIGPPAFALRRLQDGAPAVVAMLQDVLGAPSVVDARLLSADLLGPAHRTSTDGGVHFTNAGAALLAPRLAQALAQLEAPTKRAAGALKPLAWGFMSVFSLGLLALGAVVVTRRQRLAQLEGGAEPEDVIDVEEGTQLAPSARRAAVRLERLGWRIRTAEINTVTGTARVELAQPGPKSTRVVTLDVRADGRNTLTRELEASQRVPVGRRGDRMVVDRLEREFLGRQRLTGGLPTAMRELAHYVAENSTGDRALARDALRPLLEAADSTS